MVGRATLVRLETRPPLEMEAHGKMEADREMSAGRDISAGLKMIAGPETIGKLKMSALQMWLPCLRAGSKARAWMSEMVCLT